MERRIGKIAASMGLRLKVDGNTANVAKPGGPWHAGVVHTLGKWRLDLARHHSQARMPQRIALGEDDAGFEQRTRRALAPALALHARDLQLKELGIDPEKPPAWTYRVLEPGLHLLRAGGRLEQVASLLDQSGWGPIRRRRIGDAVLIPDGDRLMIETLRLGEATYSEDGRGARMSLPPGLPATVVSALPGRMLQDVVRHPLLQGWECRIVSARASEGAIELTLERSYVPLASPPAEAVVRRPAS